MSKYSGMHNHKRTFDVTDGDEDAFAVEGMEAAAALFEFAAVAFDFSVMIRRGTSHRIAAAARPLSCSLSAEGRGGGQVNSGHHKHCPRREGEAREGGRFPAPTRPAYTMGLFIYARPDGPKSIECNSMKLALQNSAL